MPQPKLNGKASYQKNLKSNKESGGTLSADLYKIYINQLLDLMQESNLGAKISNINCCAPTCADDIALAGSNPLDIQVLVNIASDYSAREAYTLQPIKTCSKTPHDNENWYMNGKSLEKVEKASHIGIQRNSRNSTLATIEENLKKSRRALYSIME
jgi:hypothetical protein